MNKLELYITTIALACVGINAQAQTYPNYQAYGTKADVSGEKNTKTPQANFFPGGRSSTNFFENTSVTPDLVNAEKKTTYGTDVFHNPDSAPAPIAVPEEEKSPEQITTQEATNNQEESWSANKNEEETEEAKNLNRNIEKASEQLSDDPRVQEVLAQSKKIKEALFGKTTNGSTTDTLKSTVVSKNPGKVTKEIERF